MHPVQHWVLDLRNPHVLAEIRREGTTHGKQRPQIMTDKLSALRRDRVRQVLGTLDTGASERLDSALLLVLGLAR